MRYVLGMALGSPVLNDAALDILSITNKLVTLFLSAHFFFLKVNICVAVVQRVLYLTRQKRRLSLNFGAELED